MTISLITATYNSAKTVEDTLRSVLAQTYKEIDYWVVDGGAKDDTMDIVRKYEPLFGGRLHWISEPDRGIYDAMTKGITHSTGDATRDMRMSGFSSRIPRLLNNWRLPPQIYG